MKTREAKEDLKELKCDFLLSSSYYAFFFPSFSFPKHSIYSHSPGVSHYGGHPENEKKEEIFYLCYTKGWN